MCQFCAGKEKSSSDFAGFGLLATAVPNKKLSRTGLNEIDSWVVVKSTQTLFFGIYFYWGALLT